MDILELIEKMEDIYKKFMISDNTPDMEADLKIQLLETISSMIAFCNLKKTPYSEELLVKINNLKEKLLIWDPFGPWFKELKELSQETYDLIALAKTFKFEEEVLPLNYVTLDDFNTFKNTIEQELTSFKSQFDSIKNLINKMEISLSNLQVPKPISQPIEVEEPTPALTPVSKPKMKPAAKPKPVSKVKPVPLQKPISKAKPVPIPKPVPITEPVPEPTPVPITEIPEPEIPEETTPKGPELQNVLSSKVSEESQTKSKLFSLFSKPAATKVQETPVKPSPSSFKSVSPVQISKPTSKPVPVQPISPKIVPIKPTKPKPATKKSATPKPVPLKPVEISPSEIEPEEPESSSITETSDSEALYHELISLQGKRYGLERGIKDLKALHQSGSMSEEEYKQKLSSKLEDLKKISAKIEKIREKLE